MNKVEIWGYGKGGRMFLVEEIVSYGREGEKYDWFMRNRKKVSLGNIRVCDRM